MRPTLPQLVGSFGLRAGVCGARAAARPAAATDTVARQRLRTGGRQRHLVLAGVRIELLRLHRRQRRRLLLRRRRRLDLDPHQLRGDRFAQALAHRLEQIEGFGLVLVERIALAVTAQPDHLAQMIEHHQMLAPQMVERLQQDRLLDIADDVGAPLRDLRRHVLVGAALDAG